MAMLKQETAARKRQQIDQANRTMFIWVAGASAVVGLAAVLIVAFTQHIIYNEAVLAKKGTTVSNLKHNNSIVDELNDNIRVLNTNQVLDKLRVPADKDSVQVIFDALPASANSAALGSALQSPELLGKSGISIESLNVKPVSGVENGSAVKSGKKSSNPNSITFDFTVTTDRSNVGAFRDAIKRLERSIRAFSIKQLRVQTSSNTVQMKVSGEGYYEPARAVELIDKVVP